MVPLSLASALILETAARLNFGKEAAPDDLRRTLPSEDIGICLSRINILVAGVARSLILCVAPGVDQSKTSAA